MAERKLNLFDIVDLAKAGYKKKDIDEILKKSNEESNNPKPDEESNNSKSDEETPPPAENGEKGRAEGKEGESKPEEDVDYKKLYEEKCEELKTAQKANTQTNLKNETAKTPSIDDIVRSFM